jgi:ankyrin repeat protein
MRPWLISICLAFLVQSCIADDFSDFLDAAAFGDKEKLSSLLDKGSVTINQRNSHGESALHLASINSKLEIVEFLLKSGADPSAFTEGSYQGRIIMPCEKGFCRHLSC